MAFRVCPTRSLDCVNGSGVLAYLIFELSRPCPVHGGTPCRLLLFPSMLRPVMPSATWWLRNWSFSSNGGPMCGCLCSRIGACTPQSGLTAGWLPVTKIEEKTRRFLSSADLVVVEYGQYYDLLEWLPLLGHGKGRVLLDYHGVTPPELWSVHNREAVEAGVRQRGLVRAADAAVVHSEFTGQELTDATGFPRDRCTSLAHPVDTNQFCPGFPGRSPADWLGLAEANVLLFVGRLAPNKRAPC